MEGAVKPVLLLLAFSGIDIAGTFNPKVIAAFAVLFNSIASLNVLKNITCLSGKTSLRFTVSEAFKSTMYVTWFVLFARRNKLRKLIRDIAALHKFLGYKLSPKVHKCSVLSVACFILYSAGLLIWHGSYTVSDTETEISCGWFVFIRKIVRYDFIESLLSFLNNNYLKTSVDFLLFTCCFGISASIRSRFKTKCDAISVYRKLFRVYRSLCNTMSPVLFAHILQLTVETLRIVTIMCHNSRLHYLTKQKEVYLMIEANSCFASVLVTVLSFDLVSSKVSKVRRYILEKIEPESCRTHVIYFKLLDDKEYLKPSALGLFDVNKSFLLTFGATVITYGFLVYELYATK